MGAESKPGTNRNVGFAIKEHAETTGKDKLCEHFGNRREHHGQKFISRVVTFIPGQKLCSRKSTFPEGLCNTGFLNRTIKSFAIYLHSVTYRLHFSEGNRRKRLKILFWLF